MHQRKSKRQDKLLPYSEEFGLSGNEGLEQGKHMKGRAKSKDDYCWWCLAVKLVCSLNLLKSKMSNEFHSNEKISSSRRNISCFSSLFGHCLLLNQGLWCFIVETSVSGCTTCSRKWCSSREASEVWLTNDDFGRRRFCVSF